MQSSSTVDIPNIWDMPRLSMRKGNWLWWFWLFFIHDENTKKDGKCRQLMILWSIKKDKQIKCNQLDIKIPNPYEKAENGKCHILNGAAAAWYYDGERMHEDIVLETSKMSLDSEKKILDAPGKTPSSFYLDGKEYVTKISTPSISFEFRALQEDFHPVVGPVYGASNFALGLAQVEGTRIEKLTLSGFQTDGKGKRQRISGTAYFQKILLGAPPSQWYWGIYHFADGSLLTYMQAYAGRAILKDNLHSSNLKKPTMSFIRDISLYHAPSGKVYESHDVDVLPQKIDDENYSHSIVCTDKKFKLTSEARSYSHACWSFVKNIGILPIKSNFRYNEYPATIPELRIDFYDGSPSIILKNGWGNMENSWGFII